jgi:hypothetical protein
LDLVSVRIIIGRFFTPTVVFVRIFFHVSIRVIARIVITGSLT